MGTLEVLTKHSKKHRGKHRMQPKKIIIPIVIAATAGIVSWQAIQTQSNRVPQSSKTAIVKKVSDGDTLTLQNGDRVRLCGIDAPEKSQKFGPESKANLQRLINRAGGQVIVQDMGRDRYNRIVGEVFISAGTPNREEEHLLNAEQLLAGMAYVYPQYVNCSQPDVLKQAEQRAIATKKGVWAGKYQKPWEFRKQQRQ
jgi:endonuclease YncB( thermonuclease family)